MRFTFFGCLITIDYSFILVLSFCAAIKAKYALLLFAFSACHEIGHLLALFIVGKKPARLSFSYYGFAIKYKSDLSCAKECFVLAAGPAVNLILYFFIRDSLNFMLFIVNMLPVYPLDSGRIVKLFAPRASKYISVILLSFICVFSLFMLIRYKSFSLIPAAVYLMVYSIAERDFC